MGQESGDVGTHSSLFVTVSFIEHYALIKKKKKAFGIKFDLNITPLAFAFLHWGLIWPFRLLCNELIATGSYPCYAIALVWLCPWSTLCVCVCF